MNVSADEDHDRHRLRSLVDRYATAADTRDDARFVALFTRDAVLRINQSGRVLGTFAAPDGLVRATAPLDQYAATMHLVANHACTLDGDVAQGATYCIANHLRQAGDAAENLAMVIRYDDRYARGADGAWRFTLRDLHILWTETRPASTAPLRF
jgi:hypothetical protein